MQTDENPVKSRDSRPRGHLCLSVCLLELTFGFEGEVAVLADVGPLVCVQTDVFAKRAGLLAADATRLTHVPASSSPAHVHILFIRLIAVGVKKTPRSKETILTLY